VTDLKIKGLKVRLLENQGTGYWTVMLQRRLKTALKHVKFVKIIWWNAFIC